MSLEVATLAVIVMKLVAPTRFAERKVRHAPRVLRMAVVSQSSVKFGKKRVLLVGATNFKMSLEQPTSR